MVKFKLTLDKDKETVWLNQLAKEGWAMRSFFAGFYTFDKCEPGQYNYQIDLSNRFGKVSEDYREFMEEAGIEIVQCWGPWVILRKPASDEGFELYTDIDSQIEQYQKIFCLFKIFAIIEILLTFVEVFLAYQSKSMISWAFVCILAAFVGMFISALINTKKILRELNERKTGIHEATNRNVSGILPAGLLLNSCALLMGDSVSLYIKRPIQILAIIFMFIGIFLTCRKRNETIEE